MIRLVYFITIWSAKGNSFQSQLRTNETLGRCFKKRKHSNDKSRHLLSVSVPGNLYMFYLSHVLINPYRNPIRKDRFCPSFTNEETESQRSHRLVSERSEIRC